MYGLGSSINVNFVCVRKERRKEARRMVNGIKLPLNATTDYLMNGADVAALTRAGVARGVLARMMLEASHSNLLETRDTDECVVSTPLGQPCVSAKRTKRHKPRGTANTPNLRRPVAAVVTRGTRGRRRAVVFTLPYFSSSTLSRG